MTAPLFHLPAGALTGVGPGAHLRLDGSEGRHAVVVRRLRVGEAMLLADGSGLLAHAEVTVVGQAELTALVIEVQAAGMSGPRLVLAQALAKGDRDEAAVETATELGVDEVLAWQAARSVVIWRGERGAKSLRRWGGIMTAAAKQSRRATVPHVAGPVTTAQLTARVASSAATGGTTYVLHEDAKTLLATQAIPQAGEIMLIVGPEGGSPPKSWPCWRARARCPCGLATPSCAPRVQGRPR